MIRDTMREWREANVKKAAAMLLSATKAATIILPLPEREGYYVVIGTAEGIKRTLDSA